MALAKLLIHLTSVTSNVSGFYINP